MKLRIISAIVAVVFCLSLVLAPVAFGKARRAYLPIVTVTTAAVSTFTSDTTITSRRISFQAGSTNSATIFIGDSTLDATSVTTLQNTCLATLAASSAWSPPLSDFADSQNEQYRLSEYRAAGTTGDKVRLIYEVIETP